uniref:Uncharacterized protein n=1 Tax=Caenorhabditis tropicalis TaxID=1561998 RepID=A0A1I7TL75_9PELO
MERNFMNFYTKEIPTPIPTYKRWRGAVRSSTRKKYRHLFPLTRDGEELYELLHERNTDTHSHLQEMERNFMNFYTKEIPTPIPTYKRWRGAVRSSTRKKYRHPFLLTKDAWRLLQTNSDSVKDRLPTGAGDFISAAIRRIPVYEPKRET